MLKIYTQDWEWRGCLLVIAKSETDARKMMEADQSYVAEEPVEEHEIVEGFTYGADAS